MTGASEYGKALFMLSEEEGKTESALAEIKAVADILKKNPEYIKLLDTPALPKPEKLALIDESFGSLYEGLVNLIKILCEKHSVYAFGEVCETFSALYDESRGIERAEVVSAVALTGSQLLRLTERLEAMTGKKIILSSVIDPSILGGIKLRYLGVQLDGSVKSRLDRFAKKLNETVI